ncbi:hypothetical protein TWF481_000033 [Arthrobotrys musiformis]|uniref:C2H2-type domain-containing protein n=1 Tax=Arthrobotrys musiformis TaxID=47236 RepID=A0AAV9WS45_9PEZI
MLQLDTRPSNTWKSPSTFNADGRILPTEFSLSKLQNSGVFELSRLSARTSNIAPTTAPTAAAALRGDSYSMMSGHNHHHQHHHRRQYCSNESDSDSSINISSNDGIHVDISRRNINTQSLEGPAKPLQPNLQSAATPLRIPLERDTAATTTTTATSLISLPPIRTSSSIGSSSSIGIGIGIGIGTSASSGSCCFRASSSSSSPSPSQSPSVSASVSVSVSPSLPPSIGEPHLPPLRGNSSPPAPTNADSRASLAIPTDNTSPTSTRAKHCQSQPQPQPQPRPQSLASNPSYSLPSLAESESGSDLVSHAVAPVSSSLLPSDRTGIDNGATASTTTPLLSGASTAASNRTGNTTTTLAAANIPTTTTTNTSAVDTASAESTDGRTSKKRSLEEYQGHSEHFPSRRAPGSIVHPLSQSLSADSIPNPFPSGLPISLASIDSISGPKVESQPSRSPPPSPNPNPSVKPVPLRLHEGDLPPNRTDIDNSVESTIVLAHRAVTLIKNQSLPRPKTIGPTFTIGKQGSHPFGVAGRPHDGVMESEDESDTGSTTTTSTPSPPNKPRMMPWDRKKAREESPAFDPGFDPDLDPTPLSGPIARPDSSPIRKPGQPGIGPLISIMGGSTDNSRMIAAVVRTDQPLGTSDSESDISQSPEDTTGDAGENSNESAGQEAAPATTATHTTFSQTISTINSRSGDGYLGDGDGGEDPNEKRARKLSEHEQDNDSESIGSGREKRRRLEEVEGGGSSCVPAEPHVPGKADQDAAVSSLFGLSKRHSPQPVPSGPPTVESVPSTAATLDSGPAYSESETPATMGGSDYYKSPVETTSGHTLPPIHTPSNLSPGRQNMSPGSTHTTLPSVDAFFAVASAAEKHSMDNQQIQPNHTPNGGTYSKPPVIQHIKIGPPTSNQNPTPNARTYVGDFGRAIPYTDPAKQWTITPRTRQSPTVSPTESRNTPIAPVPANNFPGQASTSPPNQFTYYPPKNLNRPEHPANHATLPPLQTDWPGSLPPSEPGSARTPTSKKRARNGTPKNGSIDSSQNSPTVAGGFKCNKEGCTAAPFSTQYLLNSHANVHSEDRPHFCPVTGCSRAEGGKGFKRKNEMIRHGLVHQSPGYVCPFCPDKEHRYPRPDNLQRHVKAHHKDKSGDDPLLREVLAVRPEGGQRGRRRRLGPNP